ncbi:hypothetical protein GR212_15210 [Rhizobium lusitanum]|uniref:Uncharacterized protein n=1 Tax=Rhizobium lusitanum TaxID=293958 RepID=A0A6L9U620_9HYPH|nr:hypothetical protein [Rhizobium lusitanum]NEI70931.1 hypothetical protein [Rhizobium lusitanum]
MTERNLEAMEKFVQELEEYRDSLVMTVIEQEYGYDTRDLEMISLYGNAVTSIRDAIKCRKDRRLRAS